MPFFNRLVTIDKLIKAGPQVCRIAEDLEPLLQELASRKYFLGEIADVAWLQPLHNAGFFVNPPDPIKDDQYTQYPPWPESQFLARMASKAPEIVKNIICEMRDTENIYIINDLVEAALGMPPEVAGSLVPKVTGLLESPYGIVFPDKVGKLVAHIAKSGQAHSALSLAQSLLKIVPNEIDIEQDSKEIEAYHSRSAEARFSHWEYEQILVNSIPDLIEMTGIQGLDMLCGLLDDAVTYHENSKDGNDYDGSYMWQSAINSDEGSQYGDLRNVLVSAIRDAADQIMQKSDSLLQDVVEVLTKKRWNIFRRLALHIIRMYAENAPTVASQWIVDRYSFDHVYYLPEYAALLRDAFGLLSVNDQETILSWIKQGPNLTRSNNEYKSTETTLEDADKWKLEWLQLIENHLSEIWIQRYSDLTAKYGNQHSLDESMMPKTTAFWVGPTSPKDRAELTAMSIAQLVTFLKEWQHSNYPPSPSPEGLARELTGIISTEPQRYANEATQFYGVDPTYIRAIFSGLSKAIKDDNTFSWQQVLELGRWVIEQPRDIPNHDMNWHECDPHWGWTRKALADLLEEGFKQDNALPFDLRNQVWDLLEPVTDDPDPTPEHELQFGGSNMDPATMSINTTRGEAMHAIIEYALWVRKNLDSTQGKANRSFDEMPEVRTILDRHLNGSTDPSLTIRSVYGRWFPWLEYLDSEWVRSNISKVFPQDPQTRALRNAAWDTYVTYCDPYNSIYNMIKEEYLFAAQNLQGEHRMKTHLGEPDERLARHLIILYGRGLIALDDAVNPLEDYFNNANDELRSRAISFVGNIMSSAEDEIEKDLIDRMISLWEWRISKIKNCASVEPYRKELSSFGWWFLSDRLPQDWALNQLYEAISLAGCIEPDAEVLKKLANKATTEPTITVGCLGRLLHGQNKGWRTNTWIRHAHDILATTISNNDTKETALDIINQFGASGYIKEFRDLVP